MFSCKIIFLNIFLSISSQKLEKFSCFKKNNLKMRKYILLSFKGFAVGNNVKSTISTIYDSFRYSKQCLQRKINKNRFKGKLKREKL